MIKSLEIVNYAIIDKINISFDKGFVIITGETGAGKSIILGALSLLMGQRADNSVVRDKSKKCIVEAIFDVSNYFLKTIFEKNELDYWENTVIRREITPDGRSRAFINDTPVNLSVLKDISQYLIDIHSQDEKIKLNSDDYQTEVLDLFVGNKSNIENYRKLFLNFKSLKSEIEQLVDKIKKANADRDYYQYQFELLQKANLKENEQEELEKEQEQLSHIEDIKNSLNIICSLTEDENFNILNHLKDAYRAAQVVDKYINEEINFSERLNNLIIELKDISHEAERINQKLIFDPERLEAVNNRLDLIYTLEKKFGVNSINELIVLKENLQKKLVEIDNFDEKLDALQRQFNDIKTQLELMAQEVSKKRVEGKSTFEENIKSILQNIGMSNVIFEVKIEKLQNYTNNGNDKVEFYFSANKNILPQPLSKIASGGELSRVMLAIKYIVSQKQNLPTIIFDEIDTGVSGEVARKMGDLLYDMSKNMQIINITHLPQIAAKGHTHLFVYKINNEQGTWTNVRKLTDEERIFEIAKMLSGENPTQAAIENAKNLLKL